MVLLKKKRMDWMVKNLLDKILRLQVTNQISVGEITLGGIVMPLIGQTGKIPLDENLIKKLDATVCDVGDALFLLFQKSRDKYLKRYRNIVRIYRKTGVNLGLLLLNPFYCRFCHPFYYTHRLIMWIEDSDPYILHYTTGMSRDEWMNVVGRRLDSLNQLNQRKFWHVEYWDYVMGTTSL